MLQAADSEVELVSTRKAFTAKDLPVAKPSIPHASFPPCEKKVPVLRVVPLYNGRFIATLCAQGIVRICDISKSVVVKQHDWKATLLCALGHNILVVFAKHRKNTLRCFYITPDGKSAQVLFDDNIYTDITQVLPLDNILVALADADGNLTVYRNNNNGNNSNNNDNNGGKNKRGSFVHHFVWMDVHDKAILSIAAHHGKVITGSEDCTAKIHDYTMHFKDEAFIASLPHDHPVNNVAYTDKYIITASTAFEVKVWCNGGATNNNVFPIKHHFTNMHVKSMLTSIMGLDDSILLSADKEGYLLYTDIANEKVKSITKVTTTAVINDIAILPGGKIVVAGLRAEPSVGIVHIITPSSDVASVVAGKSRVIYHNPAKSRTTPKKKKKGINFENITATTTTAKNPTATFTDSDDDEENVTDPVQNAGSSRKTPPPKNNTTRTNSVDSLRSHPSESSDPLSSLHSQSCDSLVSLHTDTPLTEDDNNNANNANNNNNANSERQVNQSPHPPITRPTPLREASASERNKKYAGFTSTSGNNPCQSHTNNTTHANRKKAIQRTEKSTKPHYNNNIIVKKDQRNQRSDGNRPVLAQKRQHTAQLTRNAPLLSNPRAQHSLPAYPPIVPPGLIVPPGFLQPIPPPPFFPPPPSVIIPPITASRILSSNAANQAVPRKGNDRSKNSKSCDQLRELSGTGSRAEKKTSRVDEDRGTDLRNTVLSSRKARRNRSPLAYYESLCSSSRRRSVSRNSRSVSRGDGRDNRYRAIIPSDEIISEREYDTFGRSFFTIYVTNIASARCNHDGLQQLFAPFGNIIHVNPYPNGFARAFVKFASRESLREAIAEMDGKEIDGLSLRVDRAIRKKFIREKNILITPPRQLEEEEVYQSPGIYVDHLPTSLCNVRDLTNLFSPFGTIKSVRVPSKPVGALKGYAFVEFDTHLAQQNAVADMHGKFIHGYHISVKRILKRSSAERKAGVYRDNTKKYGYHARSPDRRYRSKSPERRRSRSHSRSPDKEGSYRYRSRSRSPEHRRNNINNNRRRSGSPEERSHRRDDYQAQGSRERSRSRENNYDYYYPRTRDRIKDRKTRDYEGNDRDDEYYRRRDEYEERYRRDEYDYSRRDRSGSSRRYDDEEFRGEKRSRNRY